MAGRPRSADVDSALRQAGLALFVERGLPGLALDEVARRAGVSRAALYRRWSTREALLGDALCAWRETVDVETLDVVPPDDAPPSLDGLVDQLAARVGAVLADPFTRTLVRRILTLGPDGDAIRRDYFATVVAPRRAAFARVIIAARDAGMVEARIDPILVQDAIAGAFVYKLLSGEAEQHGFDGKQLALDLFRMLGLKR